MGDDVVAAIGYGVFRVVFLLMGVSFITFHESEAQALATVWNAGSVTFTKESGADWRLSENQDFLTENVILTRANSRGLFNIAGEPSYQGQEMEGSSPVGTEWARGRSENYQSLVFATWAQVFAQDVEGFLNSDLVLHLVEDDIYLDIRFTSWGQGGGGSPYSYVRSALVPEPSVSALFGLGVVALALKSNRSRARRRAHRVAARLEWVGRGWMSDRSLDV